MHILQIVGARPQFIKLAVVHRALAATGKCRQTVVHTGQHFDGAMSDVFFDELNIPPPDINLGINSLSHGAMTGRTLEHIERVLLEERPDRVIIYGDTNATLAGALAASKLLIPVGHIEAGLRSFDRRGPEEQNRIVADHLSSRLYPPTPTAVANLLREGLSEERQLRTGDVMYDCAIQFAEIAGKRSKILESLSLETRKFVLCTIHRAENTDDPVLLNRLFDGLAELAQEIRVVCPLHPRTRAKLSTRSELWDQSDRRGTNGLTVIEPIGYLDMVQLESSAAVIATDSGGVQREAYFHGVPGVSFRPHTEWTELVESGWTVLAPLNVDTKLAQIVLDRIGTQGKRIDAFGTGNAAEIIADDILSNPWIQA